MNETSSEKSTPIWLFYQRKKQGYVYPFKIIADHYFRPLEICFDKTNSQRSGQNLGYWRVQEGDEIIDDQTR